MGDERCATWAAENHVCEDADNELWWCIEGDIWGPCPHEFCSGGCEFKWMCDCACHNV